MTKLIPVLLAASLAACSQKTSLYPVVQFPTPSGDTLSITMVHHGSLAMHYKGCEIQIDPVSKAGETAIDYTGFPKADVILVTHEHGDHLDPVAIDLLSKDGTRLMLNASSQAKIGKGEVLAIGDTTRVGPFGLVVVPAYNITEGHLQFHPQGRDNGYILDFDGLRVYVSGDTEDIDEMAGFGPLDVAFLSTNQPYTMTTTQCIEAAMTLQPKVLVPYHLSDTDMQEIKTVLDSNDSGIEVLLFEELR
ncbi:MAG: MBL fold metallo-hydrolase [Bacteroidales bacterium]|nr:MBL fold metallo-hydrolase [Bacteroidales bacterium]